MGEVYLAEHKYIARRAAIKFLLPELSQSKEVVERFFNEARAASLIQHPGIVEVLDCEVHADGRAFIVMELLEGDSLRGYARAQAASWTATCAGALAICRQIASALGGGPRARHRPPRPQARQRLSRRDAEAPAGERSKLLDFGIAKLQRRRRRPRYQHAHRAADGHAALHVARSSAAARGASTAAPTSIRSAASCSRSSAAVPRSWRRVWAIS